MPTPHEPRLTRALRDMLNTQRVASLGTLNAEGGPFVSMVPFAIDPVAECLVIHVSLLAPHTRNLLTKPAVSMMVMQPEVAGEPVHALPRVSMDGTAARLKPESPSWLAARSTDRSPGTMNSASTPSTAAISSRRSIAAGVSNWIMRKMPALARLP